MEAQWEGEKKEIKEESKGEKSSSTPIYFMVNLDLNKEDPFLDTLITSLREKRDIKTQTVLSRTWIKSLPKGTILHFHWLEPFYGAASVIGSVRHLLSFLFFLLYMRSRSITLVWTIHNRLPHDSRLLFSGAIAYCAMFFFSHKIIVTGTSMMKNYFFRLFKRDIFVIPLNYEKAYKKSIGKNQARRLLGLPSNTFIYLAFGRIKKYKGLSSLCTIFKSLLHDKRLKQDSQLLIAGSILDNEEYKNIENIAKDCENIVLHCSFIPDDRLHLYFSAADVVVFSYTTITTSGPLFLSLLFQKPIIGINKGILPDFIHDNGILVNNNTHALRDALSYIQQVDTKDFEKMGILSGKLLPSLEEIRNRHLKVYDSFLPQ